MTFTPAARADTEAGGPSSRQAPRAKEHARKRHKHVTRAKGAATAEAATHPGPAPSAAPPAAATTGAAAAANDPPPPGKVPLYTHPKTASLLQRTRLTADYRIRVTRLAQDRVPPLSPNDIDTFADHRLRVYAYTDVTPVLNVGARITTDAPRLSGTRLGAFDVASGPVTPKPRFDLFYMSYHPDARTQLNLGRGGARQYEADLVVATGRFNEDDATNDSITFVKNLSKRTTAYAIYSPIFQTGTLLPGPRFNFDAYAVALAHQFDPDTTLHFFGGSLDPRQPVLGFLGDKPFTQASLRLDHRFARRFAAFGSVAYQFSHTDGRTFFNVADATSSDRTSFFGGISFGDATHLREHEVDFYYTKTGKEATSIVSEYAPSADFPDGFSEWRALWQRQMVKDIFTTASFVHREADTPALGLVHDATDTAYVQIYTKL